MSCVVCVNTMFLMFVVMFFHLYSLECLPFGVLCFAFSMGLFWLWPCVSFVFDVKAQFICIGCWPNSCVWLLFPVYCRLYLMSMMCLVCLISYSRVLGCLLSPKVFKDVS